MNTNSARFTAGHFFSKASLFLAAVLLAGSCGRPAPASVRQVLPESGVTTVLIEFPRSILDGMPEATAHLDLTAAGRFHIPDSDADTDLLQDIALAADSAGLLILAILPEGQVLPASREHLKVWVDENGLPVHSEPTMETSLFEDSLWLDPVVRQGTILQLIDFFKPDLALVCMGSSDKSDEITAFWSEHGPAEDITAGLFTMPLKEERFRGWGILTGTGIHSGVLEGMTIMDFKATILMLTGQEWADTGYLVMQAFTTADDQ